MMRFPAKFTANLARVLITQKLAGAKEASAVVRLNPLEWAARTGANETSVNEQMLAFVRDAKAPAVWIGGDTPLDYPHIGQLTNSIVKLGRTVFLEKDGRLLRRRIHEFRPVSRLYVTVELDGSEASHDSRAGSPGLFRHTLEGVRAAKLSGFLICVLTRVFADTELGELAVLAEQIEKMGADGWVITPANDGKSAPHSLTERARMLIPNRRWRRFSELLDRNPVVIAHPDLQPISDRTPDEKSVAGVHAR